MDLGISGLASGFDWSSFVDKMIEVERAPETTLRTDQDKLNQQNNAYGSIKTQLTILQNRINTLSDASLYSSRLGAVSDSEAASVTAAAGTPLGSYNFAVSQLATAARLFGTANIGKPLSSTSNVSSLVLGTAAFPLPITGGTFSVNGTQITIATTDNLQQVFDKISTATGGTVTGSYDPTADKISLTGASPIILGSATDSSNFLQAARLYNNGTGAVTSTSALGSIKTTGPLNSANFATAVSDGGSGAGEFKINGVSISYNVTTDSLTNVLDRINQSAAGVAASYDLVNDQIVLTNRSTGDMGVGVQDVTGNFLNAAGLIGGSLTRGQDLLYTINGGATLRSQSNTIAADSSGIPGLSVTVLKSPAALTSSPTTTTTSTSTTTQGVSNPDEKIVYSFGGGGGSSTKITTASATTFLTGDPVRLRSTGTLPSMVNDTTTYYIKSLSANTVSLHRTLADAVGGSNPIDFGTNPSYTGDAFLLPYDPFAVQGGSTTTTTTSSTPGGSSGGTSLDFTVTVTPDTAKVRKAITDFVDDYNKTQSLIDTQTASSTNAQGKVTAGILATDGFANEISSRLRALSYAQISGLPSGLKGLASLGFDTNGTDNSLNLGDSDALDAALSSNLIGIQNLFIDTSNGVAVHLASYLDKTIGDDGTLVTKQDTLTRQAGDIDTQIANMERIIADNKQRMVNEFLAMETAQATINQQMSYLTSTFGGSSSTAKSA